MNNTIQKLLHLFETRPYTINMGAGAISKWQRCSVKEVKQAKEIFYVNKNNKENSPVNILILDIETAPLKAYVWSRWRQNIYLEQTISEWFMISWSAKWLGEDFIYGERISSKDILKENDGKILKGLWELLNKADIVVTHNGKRFDIPKINSRFLIHELPPPSPYKQIDTREISARKFGFSSNKLDALAVYFGYEKKLDTDFELWAKCMEGDVEALTYMLEYNKKDIILLEEVYLKLRPYIPNHPNIGVYYNDNHKHQCSHCGSTKLKRDGNYYTNVSKYLTYRCSSCGAISRTRTTISSKEKREQLLTSVR